MGNRSAWAIAISLIVVIVAGVSVMAYLFRYEPLIAAPEGGGLYYVWDRWKHRVGISSPALNEIIYPGELRDKSAAPTDSGEHQRNSSLRLNRFEVLRQAGFPEKEILDYIFEERQKLKDSGATDKQIYDYFFSPDQPKTQAAGRRNH